MPVPHVDRHQLAVEVDDPLAIRRVHVDALGALDGQQVVLSLRPEKVSIAKEKPQAHNALPGRVIDIAYLGNISTYHVELPDGTMIKAQMANTRRIARRDITWEDEVWVSFTATAGVVLTE